MITSTSVLGRTKHKYVCHSYRQGAPKNNYLIKISDTILVQGKAIIWSEGWAVGGSVSSRSFDEHT